MRGIFFLVNIPYKVPETLAQLIKEEREGKEKRKKKERKTQ